MIERRLCLKESADYAVIEVICPKNQRHGSVPLGDFSTVAASAWAAGGDRALSGFDPSGALFLDLETTGLGGGRSFAFLVGTGRLSNGRIVLRQYFLKRPQAEAYMLEDVHRHLLEADGLVTFNGLRFDAPLLLARFRYHEVADAVPGRYHLDLLPTTRRLWGGELDSCRLTALEEALMDFVRFDDVPGREIPPLYAACLSRGCFDPLEIVFRHNLLDIKATVALAVLATRRALGGRPKAGQGSVAPQVGLNTSDLAKPHTRATLERLADILDRKGRRESSRWLRQRLSARRSTA